MPAGKFQMDSDKSKVPDAFDYELPRHEVYLDEYWMGKYPVTNAHYEEFVKAIRHRQPSHWKNGEIPFGKEKHPVVYVSWEDARAFCDWASKVSKQRICLPSEAEWEKAARGTYGRIFPWGNKEADASYCNYSMNNRETTVVGKYSPKRYCPYNCADMNGNVWEWTRSLW